MSRKVPEKNWKTDLFSVGEANNKTTMAIKGCDPDSRIAKTGCVDAHSDSYFTDGNGVSFSFSSLKTKKN